MDRPLLSHLLDVRHQGQRRLRFPPGGLAQCTAAVPADDFAALYARDRAGYHLETT
ncbi:hypothetical protein OH786_01225 [Streptomyces atratus]|uniref:Uncharacterized protein n=1 Tax=Streptomyces atratus TaxID=1893 RepID=A0A1K1YFI2_STRAR|nr:hypothetical protein [Streptomyces atratus]SFX60679.1 hypothetical protein SAMN02787144_1004268 [Streptomyces atratus]